jgi:hypothetical protein
MKIRLQVIILICTCLLNACSYGLVAKKFPPAQGPHGVMMTIESQRTTFRGELIEVHDNGVILLIQNPGISVLTLVPFTAVRSSDVDQMGGHFQIKNGRPPKPELLAELRLISRIPQGLTPELLQQLLAVYKQTELAGLPQ